MNPSHLNMMCWIKPEVVSGSFRECWRENASASCALNKQQKGKACFVIQFYCYFHATS